MAKYRSIDKVTIRLFIEASLVHKKLLFFALLHPLASVLLSTVVPYFIGKIIASLAIPGSEPLHYIPYFVSAAVVGVIANRYGFSFLLKHQAKTMSDLQSRALNVLLRRSTGFHSNNIGGKLVSDAIDFPNGYSQLANAALLNLIPFTIVLIAGSALVFKESWLLGLVISTTAVVTVLWGVLESRRRSTLRVKRLEATKAVTGHLADTILNVQTVKTFANEQVELARHEDLNNTLLAYRLHDWTRVAYQGSNRIAALLALQLVFVLTVVHQVQQNPHLLAIGIFAFSFTITLSNKLFEVNTMIRNIEDGLLAASPMTAIIQEEPEIRDTHGAKPLAMHDGGITFNDVSFTYVDSSANHAVFTALNLDIKPGEKIGLVGPSGGGKSTLTRLILRFDDIQDGSIIIDGQNIAEVTQTSLREAISYVPQEPLLFHRTILENIAYGTARSTIEDVRAAARKAHADEFIMELPDGYDTIVGERGVKLSGGQRQRIAIARAMLKDAPILVLDEATSALDSESEAAIQKALWKLMAKHTAIVIAHRLSTIQKMDRIIVLEHGAITEQGTHEQLLKRKGTYANLWAHQSGGFLEQ